ncbi:MAG: hypothetical protein K6F27_12595 [Ruminococcus sp.]|nr:hypothetical protein [Ruminococcus sp.]
MNTSNAEQERKQDNQDLMKQTFKDEMKKTHRIDWADMIAIFIGTVLGLSIRDAIDTKRLIANGFGRFCVNVLIITIAILAVQGIFAVVRKMRQNSKN